MSKRLSQLASELRPYWLQDLPRTTPQPSTGGAAATRGGKPYSTIVVAPYDCQAADRSRADVVLTGDNDAAQINQQLLIPGRRILILDGHVILKSPLELNDYLVIEGMGTGVTFLESWSGAGAALSLLRNTAAANDVLNDLELRRFTLDGNSLAQPEGDAYGLYLQQPGSEYNTRLLIEDVDFTNMTGTCISLVCVDSLWLNRCMFSGNTGKALTITVGNDVRIANSTFSSGNELDFDCNRTTIHACRFTSPTTSNQRLVYINGGDETIFSDNLVDFLDSDSTATRPWVEVEGSYRVNVTGNIWLNTKLRVENCYFVNVTGNTWDIENDEAIEAQGGEHLTIANNYVLTAYTDTQPNASISLASVEHAYIVGNKVTAAYTNDPRSYAIELDSDCDFIAVCYNDFTDCYTAGQVQDGSGSAVIEGNIPLTGSSGYTDEMAQDAAASMITGATHSGLTVSYNDAGNTLAFTVTGGGYTDEQAQDAAASLFTTATHSGVSVSYNDGAGTLAITNADTGSAAVTTHEAAGDPHPQYLTATEGNAAYAAASHTHTASGVTDFAEAVDDRVAALLVAGSNVTLTYNDGAGTLTIAASGGTATAAELLVDGAGAFLYDDGGDILYEG